MDTLDIRAPGHVLEELTDFVARETARGPAVARQLVEETVTLRQAC